MKEQRYKVFVRVTLDVSRDGSIRPLSIEWLDGHVYAVDRLKDVRRAASTKVGGGGIRYTVQIGRQETFLFYEEGKWYVESKSPDRSVAEEPA